MNEAFSHGVERLRANGFDLLAVFNSAELPQSLYSAIVALGVEPARYQRLVLLGNSGGRMWDALKRFVGTVSSAETDHPVDQFSILNVEQVVRDDWGGAAIEIIYPGEPSVSLQQIGRLAGWHHDSPLGVGINSAHGLWFAYRVAFLIDAALPLAHEAQSTSPCASCEDHACAAACPAGAVRYAAPFAWDSCISFALADDSPCQAACLAREACPVATQDRYSREQISYHYRRATAAIRKYRSTKQ